MKNFNMADDPQVNVVLGGLTWFPYSPCSHNKFLPYQILKQMFPVRPRSVIVYMIGFLGSQSTSHKICIVLVLCFCWAHLGHWLWIYVIRLAIFHRLAPLTVWRHQMKTFSAWLALCERNPPVIAGDLRRHRAHYDVTVMETGTIICEEKRWRIWVNRPNHTHTQK